MIHELPSDVGAYPRQLGYHIHSFTGVGGCIAWKEGVVMNSKDKEKVYRARSRQGRKQRNGINSEEGKKIGKKNGGSASLLLYIFF